MQTNDLWIEFFCNIAVIHVQPYTYTRGNIVNTIMTNETQVFRKIYLSPFIRNDTKGLRGGYVWEVSWRLNKDCNILTPSSPGYSNASFSSCGAAQPGALRAQFSAGSGSHCFELQQLTPNSDLQQTHFLSHPGYIIVCRPPASCGVTIRTQFNPSTVKVIS